MTKKLNKKHINAPGICKTTVLGAVGLACLCLSSGNASAQITNALDTASDPAYSGGNFDTGYNGGFGFGIWTLNTPGGGHYVGGGLFGLWNNAYGAGTGSFATRAFNSTLSVGQAFSTSFKTGHLNSNLEQEGFNLEDSSGNILFSYWQQGGNNANGNYSDANGAGTATGFAYNYNSLNGFVFTLDSFSTYTFTDLATSESLSGTISGTVDQVQFFRQNLAGDPSTGGGGDTDFRFYDMQISTVPEPSVLALFGIGGIGMFFIARRRLA